MNLNSLPHILEDIKRASTCSTARLVGICIFQFVFITENLAGTVLILYNFYPVNRFYSVVPHITDAIQEWVMKQARISVDDDGVEPQVCVIEVSLA